MKIYLIRHGQSSSDIEDRYGGSYDDHLTPLGQEQAEALGRKLDGKRIETIFSSPLLRAWETAVTLARILDVPIAKTTDFRERDRYGILSGMNKNQAAADFPDQVALLSNQHSVLEEGEGYEPFIKRVTTELGRICRLDYQTIAIITHGGPMRMIFREILSLGEINIKDSGYAILDFSDNKLKLVDRSDLE